MRKFIHSFLLILMAALFIFPAMAADTDVVWGESYALSHEDLSLDETTTGVLLTEVPVSSMGTVHLGSRQLRAGDALTYSDLSSITFTPSGELVGDAVISCITMTEDGLGDSAEAVISVGNGQNSAPIAEDSSFTTYKNIPGQVTLKTSDPDGDSLIVTIVKDPKRGTVTVAEDGTVTYTPKENKVGKDSFTYYVTDACGNTSGEATVRVEILKPEHKETYADMAGDEDLLSATWLRETGIFTAETIDGQSLFQPDKTVTRGEFIAMCAALTGSEAELSPVTVSFADEVPTWLMDSVSTAVQCGYLSGIPAQEGLILSAQAEITQGEAATMITEMLNLPMAEAQTVMADTQADWAADAVMAVSNAGILEISSADAPLTRRDAARLLYQAGMMAEDETENTLLSWAKD